MILQFIKTTGPFWGGVLFAVGLGVGGMTEAKNILGFLDVFGDWRPELAFVLIGAAVVYAIGYRLILRRKHPLFAPDFLIPKRTDIDRRLLVGAAIFGIGWGVTGLCPGPGIVTLSSGSEYALVYVIALLIGIRLGQSKWGQRV